MLDRISDLLKRSASTRNILIFLALFILFEAAILPMAGARLMSQSASGTGPIDLNLVNTPARLFEMVADYTDQGRSTYVLIELTGDVLFPIVYSLFLSLTLTKLLGSGFPSDHPAQRLALLPLLGALCDYLENIGIIALLLTHPSQNVLAALLPTVFTPLKWLMFGLSVISLIVAVAALLQRRRQPARAQP